MYRPTVIDTPLQHQVHIGPGLKVENHPAVIKQNRLDPTLPELVDQ
ncbi:uncharacterized protein METZ01_LOCUS360689 [marine metagenome]|uniref:Uncharacterized protein n=1 Tax=marine metagenome TaxID=408172 RepID=A0A382SEE6_9ZZZZ